MSDETKSVLRIIFNDKDFMRKYMYLYLDRFVYQNLSLENPTSEQDRKDLINNMLEAFNVLLLMPYDKISPYEIKEVGNCVNDAKWF